METEKIYEDIAQRTDGDVYIGDGSRPFGQESPHSSSALWKPRCCPNIDNVYRRVSVPRMNCLKADPGRMIMTTEPKFVPEEAAEIKLDGGASCSVRLIDCVGYLVDRCCGANGSLRR